MRPHRPVLVGGGVYSPRVAVQPDPRGVDAQMRERGWYDVHVGTVAPYELVTQPARPGIYFLVDTRRPNDREARLFVYHEPHRGWTFGGEQPPVAVFGSFKLREAVEAWVDAHP